MTEKWTEFETHCCFSVGTAIPIIVCVVLLVSQGGGMMQIYVYGCVYILYNDSPAKSEQNERKVTSRMWLFVDENGHGSANQCYRVVQDTSGMQYPLLNTSYT